MATTNKQGAGSQLAGQGAENNQEQQKLTKKRRTGEAKKSGRARVGPPVSYQEINAATAEKSAVVQRSNGRSRVAAGLKDRADAETNLEASDGIFEMCREHEAALEQRELTKTAVGGGKLIAAQLSALVQVAALSMTSAVASASLDGAAYVSKRRDALLRVLPGHANAAVRGQFGLNVPMRSHVAASVRDAASALLAGMKALPTSRAAKVLKPDEKQLRALAKSLSSSVSAAKKSRAATASRTTERDVLNAALELFFDDYAACIGLVLEGDEVARIAALELIPRRPERRDVPAEGTGVTGGDSTAGEGAVAAAVSQVATAKA
jgi:hypothetical protein